MATALALARRGLPVRVLERAADWTEVGAGVQLGPNAMRALARLGVADAVTAAGFLPEAAEIRLYRSGLRVFEMPLGPTIAARHGAPYVQIHRADLLAILVAGARAAGADLRGNTCVTGYVRHGAAVVARLADGAEMAGAALIGADGIGSAVHATMLGGTPARFTGMVAWRALVAADALPRNLVAARATIWAGPGRHIVTYRLRGGALINIVAVLDRPDWQDEGWMVEGDPDDLRAAFTGWHPAVTDLLAAVRRAHLWALRDRPPLARWTDGPVALLGDACHPMLPFLAQGAAMAIEDAVVLAECLGAAAPEPALARYAALRRARTARVQNRARANGPLFHARGAVARLIRFAPMALATRLAPAALPRAFDWLYGHDVGE